MHSVSKVKLNVLSSAVASVDPPVISVLFLFINILQCEYFLFSSLHDDVFFSNLELPVLCLHLH